MENKLPDHIKNVCKIGQGAECCKYLTMSVNGWGCERVNPRNKEVIDQKWATEEHVAQGDNCEGQLKLNDMP